MATFTENYNLIKPDEADYYDVTDFNENFDAIDEVMAAAETELNGISDKIGTPTEEGQTLFSLLQGNASAGGFTAIKSIQRVVTSCNSNSTNTTTTLQHPIVAANSLPILQMLDGNTSIKNYTLSDTAIKLEHSSGMSSSVKFHFWIIEFC